MLIASTTLTGNSTHLIREALESVVDWVDICLVIDTGVTDESLSMARSVAGEKYVERRFTWRQDFAAARNFALDAAFAIGASWSLTLDTDERIQLNGEDIRNVIASAREDVLMMPCEDRSYAKERFFRLPARQRFKGPTHEYFPAYKVGMRTLEHATFREVPKSPEQLRRKFERDLEILSVHTRVHPTDPRWWFYLGETQKNLGRHADAVQSYDACALLRGWSEESAWACYRAAECLGVLGRHREAIDRCAAGLARHAGMAELPWLAAFCAYQQGDDAQAVYWARLAAVHGMLDGSAAPRSRLGFRNPTALYEGPYDVLRFALRRMGDGAGADLAEQRYLQALAARSATTSSRPASVK